METAIELGYTPLKMNCVLMRCTHFPHMSRPILPRFQHLIRLFEFDMRCVWLSLLGSLFEAFPFRLSLSGSLFQALSFRLSLHLSLHLSLSTSLSPPLSLHLSLSPPLSLHLSLSPPLSLSTSLSPPLSLHLSLSILPHLPHFPICPMPHACHTCHSSISHRHPSSFSRGHNDDELGDFAKLAMERPVDVRFIEFMPFDGNRWKENLIVPSSELLDRLKRQVSRKGRANTHTHAQSSPENVSKHPPPEPQSGPKKKLNPSFSSSTFHVSHLDEIAHFSHMSEPILPISHLSILLLLFQPVAPARARPAARQRRGGHLPRTRRPRLSLVCLLDERPLLRRMQPAEAHC